MSSSSLALSQCSELLFTWQSTRKATSYQVILEKRKKKCADRGQNNDHARPAEFMETALPLFLLPAFANNRQNLPSLRFCYQRAARACSPAASCFFASQPQSTTSFGNNIAIATSCALRRSCTFSLLSMLTSRVSCDDAFGGGNASGGNWDRSASRVRSVSLLERGRPKRGFAWPLNGSRLRPELKTVTIPVE